MQSNVWNFIAATVAGTAHLANDTESQDACECDILYADDSEVFVAVAADGAGSAKNGRAGARAACASLLHKTRTAFEKGGSVENLSEKICRDWIENLQNEIKMTAEQENCAPSEFSCTLLAAIVGADATVFMQIGDGAIVYGCDDSNEYKLFALPQQGEYANSTNFVTDDRALDVLKYELIEKTIDELAIFTDGLQRLTIDFQNARPHQPFFRSMLAPLRAQLLAENLEKKLSEFLDSPKINERTNDDKTLILAARRAV
jgi:hypothetical protein